MWIFRKYLFIIIYVYIVGGLGPGCMHQTYIVVFIQHAWNACFISYPKCNETVIDFLGIYNATEHIVIWKLFIAYTKSSEEQKTVKRNEKMEREEKMSVSKAQRKMSYASFLCTYIVRYLYRTSLWRDYFVLIHIILNTKPTVYICLFFVAFFSRCVFFFRQAYIEYG